jgi:hypothetical protein
MRTFGNLGEKAGSKGGNAEELPKGYARCCGYGGHVAEANSELFDYVVKSRTDSGQTISVYCINCRDVFAGRRKPVLHILDLLFGIELGKKKLPV